MWYRISYISMLSVIAALAWQAPRTFADNAAPSTQPAADPVDIRDYCTVILAKKLQDHLHCTADQQEHLADLKTRLYAYLDNAAGNMHGRPTAGLVAARGETALNMIGKLVRQELTAEQRAELGAMFDDHTLKPIKVTGAVGNKGVVVVSGIGLDYTHYGEKDDANSGHAEAETGAAPTTRPTVSSERSANRGASSPAQPHRPAVDVKDAIAGLSSTRDAARNHAAMQLALAVPTDADRASVLDALRPLVADPTSDHWSLFATAYADWAPASDEDQLKTWLTTADGLKQLDKPKPQSAICIALLRFDRPAGVDAINQRTSELFFRSRLMQDAKRWGENDPSAKATADQLFDQLKHYHDGDQIALKP